MVYANIDGVESIEIPNGKNPIVDAVRHPNDLMSGDKMLAFMFGSYLVEPYSDFLMWHWGVDDDGNMMAIPGRPASDQPDNFAGFTVLPSDMRHTDATGTYWLLKGSNHDEWRIDEDDAFTLSYQYLTEDGFTGISPASSVAQEGKIRDGLAQQQLANLLNGGRPDLIVKITASTARRAQELRDEYETKNRGAVNQGGIVYDLNISDPLTGSNVEAVEVTPVGFDNRSMAVEVIDNYTKNGINASMGVSPIMFGDATTTSYQNQQIVERNFAKTLNAYMDSFLNDLLFTLQSKFSTPLNFDFAYDDAEVEISDDEKVRAETKYITAQSVQIYANLGVPAAQITELVGIKLDKPLVVSPAAAISQRYAVASPQAQPANTTINNNFPASEGSEEMLIENKKKDDGGDSLEKAHKGAMKRRPDDYNALRDDLEKIAKVFIKRASRKNKALSLDDQKYINIVLVRLQEAAESGGDVVARQLASQIKDRIVLRNYEISQNTYNLLAARANVIVSSLDDFVSKQAMNSGIVDSGKLSYALSQSLKSGEISVNLDLAAKQGQKYAFDNGQIDNAVQIEQAYDITLIKTVVNGSNPCEFCAAMNGSEAGAKDVLVNADPTSTLGTVVGEYTDGTTPDFHANCQCEYEWSVAD